MKITAVRPWLVRVPWDFEPSRGQTRAFVFVQVDTDEGLRGWGEVTTYPGPAGNRAIAAFIRSAQRDLEELTLSYRHIDAVEPSTEQMLRALAADLKGRVIHEE